MFEFGAAHTKKSLQKKKKSRKNTLFGRCFTLFGRCFTPFHFSVFSLLMPLALATWCAIAELPGGPLRVEVNSLSRSLRKDKRPKGPINNLKLIGNHHIPDAPDVLESSPQISIRPRSWQAGEHLREVSIDLDWTGFRANKRVQQAMS